MCHLYPVSHLPLMYLPFSHTMSLLTVMKSTFLPSFLNYIGKSSTAFSRLPRRPRIFPAVVQLVQFSNKWLGVIHSESKPLFEVLSSISPSKFVSKHFSQSIPISQSVLPCERMLMEWNFHVIFFKEKNSRILIVSMS